MNLPRVISYNSAHTVVDCDFIKISTPLCSGKIQGAHIYNHNIHFASGESFVRFIGDQLATF